MFPIFIKSQEKSMFKKAFLAMAILSLVVLATNSWPANGVRAVAPEPPGTVVSAQATGANLLANPEFDDYFYFRPTNHLVANMWYEWFWASPYRIPEFIDGGHPYHDKCYPLPPAGQRCESESGRNGSQGYILMAGTFVAGVYQSVNVATCGLYQFQAYNRNDALNYRPKVGIDPTGEVLPPYIPPDGDDLPRDCPPDGHSKCPNPGLSDPSKLPSHIQWSDPVNPPAYTWTPISVSAEARASTISVWTYAAPSTDGSQSTYWDHASLVQVLPASGALIDPGTLPSADGTILNVVTSTTAIRADLSWQTSQPALTQVLYHYVGVATDPSPPAIVTSTSAFELHTPPGTTTPTSHSARLINLAPNSLYDYAILSRKLQGGSCQTSALTGRFSTTDALLPDGSLLPSPSGIVAGPIILPFATSAYAIWQSAQPSYGQVLYRHVVTPTLYPNRIYLPMISGGGGTNYGSTSNYEFRTLPDFTLSTLHVITLTSHLTPSEPYAAVAVSAWGEDEATASTPTYFRMNPSTTTTANVNSGQLVEQLQACLAEGKKLDVCVDALGR
jgi:hypothetical protein